MEWLKNIFTSTTRISRLRFNLVLLVALIPATIAQFIGMEQTLTTMWDDMLRTGHAWTMADMLQEASTNLQLADALNLLTLLILTPVMVWRLNDLGWNRRWTIAIYLPLALDLTIRFSSLPLGAVNFAVGAFAFILLTRMASKKGVPPAPIATTPPPPKNSGEEPPSSLYY